MYASKLLSKEWKGNEKIRRKCLQVMYLAKYSYAEYPTNSNNSISKTNQFN
jgi:hypothetical protein